jgi:hypothetical protein
LEHLVVRFVNISCPAEDSLTMPQHQLKILELAKQLQAFSQTMDECVFSACPQLSKSEADLCPTSYVSN